MSSLVIIFCGIIFLLFLGSWGKIEWMLDLVVRCVLGTISIYFVNVMLAYLDIPVEVGINSFTVLTSAILGIPGVLGLYGIGIYLLL